MRPAAWVTATRPYALLAGLCLLLYLPGIAAIPALDRDEARFAQATRQMLQTGDLLRIRFQDEARNSKPAGIYWLQALAVGGLSTAASTAIWPYRVPSVLGGTLAVLLTFAFGGALLREAHTPRRAGAIAGVLLAGALGVVAETHIAKTDAVLLAAIVAGQGALGLAYVAARNGRPVSGWIAVVFWTAEAAALMFKGPPGPGLAALTAASLSIADRDVRWLRGLRPLTGLALAIVALAPWLIAVELATEGRFLSDSLGHDLVPRLLRGRESHGAPPLTYLAIVMAVFWPGSLLLLRGGVRAWRHRAAPAERFLIAWIVPAWALLEVVPTKLPHYLLPLLPALALLAAGALVEDDGPLGGLARRLDLAVTGLWIVATVGVAVLLVALPPLLGGGITVGAVVGAVAVVALAAALLMLRPGPGGTAALLAALSLCVALPMAAEVLPGLDQLWLSRAAAGVVAQHPAETRAPLVAVGYSEPSLVFLLGTELRLSTPSGAAERLRDGGTALVSDRDDGEFRRDLSARGLAARPLGSVAGLDYSNGRRLVLTLYAVARAEAGRE